MNNDELNTFLAREVMGWHIGTIITRFSKEVIECYKDKNDKAVMLIQGWHPTTDIAQAMMCTEKWCDDAGGHYSLEGGFEGSGEFVYHVVLKKWNPRSQSHKRYTGEGTKELAICLALYESKKGGEK